MQKPQFANDEIYHIYNRGVEKRKIFLDKQDYLRFIHDLFEFNDETPAINTTFYFDHLKNIEVQPRYIKQPRKLLVEILCFSLLPNHFHLLLRQKKDQGIIKFMQKLGTGYTMYFNQKYKRVGSLFQGRFKATLVKQESHFIYLPDYIHLNPLDAIEPNWREGKIKNYKEAIRFLENYRWSSYLDYTGKKNFPSVTSRKFLLGFFDGPEEYKKQIENWLKEIHLEEIGDLLLE